LAHIDLLYAVSVAHDNASLATPAPAPFWAGRRVTTLLPAAAGMSRLPGGLSARYERDRNQLVQGWTAARWTGHHGAGPHQLL